MTPGAEGASWFTALAGPVLFLAASLMPWFGGHANWRACCEEREFTSEWDGCLIDGFPIV